MELKNIIFIIVFLATFGFFAYSVNNLIKYIKVAKKKDDRFDNIPTRLKNVWNIAFAQTKLLREPVAGTLHLLIFWGFVLFIFAVLETIIQGFYSPFSLSALGPVYSLITIVQDLFGLLVIISILISLYRRFIQKVPRLDVETHGKLDAAFILLLILFIVVAMYGQNAAGFANNGMAYHKYELRPVSSFLSGILFAGQTSTTNFLYEFFWWMHIILIFIFLNYLPYSKHLHVLTSILNVYFANLDPVRNTLKKLNLDDENAETFGAADIDQLSWKQILDGYSCTECGRCTAACPANIVGKSLSPKEIIVDIRKRTFDKAPLIVAGVTEGELFEKTLVHNYVTDTALWECTTCMACVQECPIMIEHLDSIVDMRRDLVLTESEFPAGLNPVFKSLETNFSPWAFNPADRAEWADGMNIKSLSEDKDGEVLFWVGCAGSFDDRYKKVSKAFATIMQKAGVDFRILGTEEKCNGDTARRLGNEYLAQMMMQENVETLNGYGVKKIVTACPHCFHSLKNEYPQFGGNFEVKHHTQFIEELLSDGKIQLNKESEKHKVTYHDSCYLGRYNDVYDAPRKSLSEVAGIDLVEMERNKSRGFCCGAGGGRMFLEDEEGGRINEERAREALSTNADTIASACPFCMTMMTDGVKHHEKSEVVVVKDIAEIILENIN
ncbi:MAG: 4Fe-4S dicluster domain-containing protein [Ignavibacteriaceae bacterium]|nr:4Fe-4S dicluster domain-containing protein [Ignavibacterium sp.]MCC6255190.1 4Fe-4S dicluster domain-containing protein [Ignavibacteriaceae bacterium]HRN28021.1 heterodisulfide reductase-related iron-sulfur binding cluster [Ignavibacteriaceae bacterium]HRQ55497.1 heterodisulfide reductase-related iron-sulfur binding cluster [Ignavibacteriaceae bacterium]